MWDTFLNGVSFFGGGVSYVMLVGGVSNPASLIKGGVSDGERKNAQ